MRITALVRSTAACLLAGGTLALAATGPAQAATSTHSVPGIDAAVSCLTATRCMVAGQATSGHGVIIPVDDGVPGRGAVVKSTMGFSAISCPSRAGCWALGLTNENAESVLAEVTFAGRVTRVITLSSAKVPALTAISCTSMSACEVAGGSLFSGPPFGIAVGSWNGSRLRVQTVASPANATDTMITQISCHRGYCVAVGYGQYGSEVELGAVLTISRGHPGKAHATLQSVLSSVSCVSDSTCYAVGANPDGAGVLVTIRDGKVSAARPTPAALAGIACVGSRCTVAGQAASGSIGELAAASAGRLTGPPATEPAVFAYNEIAGRGPLGGFAAIGTAQGNESESESELTVGTALPG
jgi:hypothetical protein